MKVDYDLYFKKAVDLIAIMCLVISYDLYIHFNSNYFWLILIFISVILYTTIPSISIKGEKKQ